MQFSEKFDIPVALELNDHLPVKISKPQRACLKGVRGQSGMVLLEHRFFNGKYYTSENSIQRFVNAMNE